MSRIPTAATVADAPEASRGLPEGVQEAVGAVPNLYRLTATSPAALEGLLSLGGALGKGVIDSATGERIALAVAEINGCDYCLAAHSFVGKLVAKLDDAEIAANRNGGSTDPRVGAAIRFAAELVRRRGKVSGEAIDAVRAAGYGDAAILEIVGHVALNTFTNYVNEAFATEIDFPAVPTRKAA